MPDKEKTLKLALQFPTVMYMADEDICNLTGLTVADLDENFTTAEICYLKAYNKLPKQPVSIRHKFDVGNNFTEEIKSWVDYYFREENHGTN